MQRVDPVQESGSFAKFPRSFLGNMLLCNTANFISCCLIGDVAVA